MTQAEIFTNLRRMIGQPEPNRVSDRILTDCILSASDWFITETKNTFRLEENLIGLVADQVEYPVPSDLAWILFAEWNSVRLDGASHFQWDRTGTDYRAVTSGNPSGFALIGRTLVLNPPPSDDAIDTADTVTLKFVATSPTLGVNGIPAFSDSDTRCMIAEAAVEYLGLNPSEENMARMAFAEKQVAKLLPAAKARAERPILDQSPQFRPPRGRLTAAR